MSRVTVTNREEEIEPVNRQQTICLPAASKRRRKRRKRPLPWPRQEQLFLYESKEAIKQNVTCQTSLMFNTC